MYLSIALVIGEKARNDARKFMRKTFFELRYICCNYACNFLPFDKHLKNIAQGSMLWLFAAKTRIEKFTTVEFGTNENVEMKSLDSVTKLHQFYEYTCQPKHYFFLPQSLDKFPPKSSNIYIYVYIYVYVCMYTYVSWYNGHPSWILKYSKAKLGPNWKNFKFCTI
jgi:hypothetical protein